ncbi:MAG: hypothetical protein Q9M94_06355 [Candidatus Gracilibacteria bacterium]|nr:hypothetical protein [Candidatus Gracilibacteria bacterium]MDQ7023725.1 hypothetical protein [Candidatus Gracilibacteria bacterium]
MENIYTLVNFELNKGIEFSEWKKLSADINDDLKNADGLHFRDSGIDDKGNVYCILKWESDEAHKTFEVSMNKTFAEHPEMMKEFGRIANMATMITTQVNLI